VNATTLVDFDAAELLARLDAPISRISSDSRRLGAGDAFAAYPGAHQDGRAYIPDAISRGASAILWETQGFHWNRAWDLPHLPIDELKLKLGFIADAVYGHPSRDLWTVGVTGTNGKTSCTSWIAAGLDAAGRRAAVIGTLGNGLIGAVKPASNTTPDAALLQQMLADYRVVGAQAAVMEVSSHGIDQGRVNGVKFDIALFTNLSRDHLDYHGTMAAYGAAKAKLFVWPGLRVGVINADDPFGQSLLDSARRHGRKTLSYGFGAADILAAGVRALPDGGLEFAVETPWGRGQVSTPLVGTFNAANLLGVLGVLLVSGVALELALSMLASFKAPPGRMQRLGGGDRPLAVIDYAHTPDALDKVLTALRSAVGEGGELICLFGCGGERDRGKRPEMGRLAGRLADRVVVTSDNPRSEDPAAIASEIVHGLRDTGNRRYSVELDRAIAIAGAIGEAKRGDVVLLAGKGHETTQECDRVRQPFSDVEHAARALEAWSAR
jgi:UDP-N-acetylmuramoyl-L-alanyl-D-glutamate--2,6-diaminopimelate ligase